RRGGAVGGRGDRARRAAGRHRQRPAPAGLPRRLRPAPPPRPAAGAWPPAPPPRQPRAACAPPSPNPGARRAPARRRPVPRLPRGEYLDAACGEDGVRVFDVSMIDHKGFSERVFTAPVSPLGQKFYVRTKYAMAVAAPTTTAPDPTRTHDPRNREQPVHALYGY